MRGQMKNIREQRFNIWVIGDPEGDTGISGMEKTTRVTRKLS